MPTWASSNLASGGRERPPQSGSLSQIPCIRPRMGTCVEDNAAYPQCIAANGLAPQLFVLQRGRVRQQSISSNGASVFVPCLGGLSFNNCIRMKLNPAGWHYSPTILLRASDQGIGWTFPASNSLVRRAISASHADSESLSRVSSRLSSSDPARAARASDGSLRAFSKSLSISCFISILYQSRKRHRIFLRNI